MRPSHQWLLWSESPVSRIHLRHSPTPHSPVPWHSFRTPRLFSSSQGLSVWRLPSSAGIPPLCLLEEVVGTVVLVDGFHRLHLEVVDLLREDRFPFFQIPTNFIHCHKACLQNLLLSFHLQLPHICRLNQVLFHSVQFFLEAQRQLHFLWTYCLILNPNNDITHPSCVLLVLVDHHALDCFFALCSTMFFIPKKSNLICTCCIDLEDPGVMRSHFRSFTI